MNVLDFVKLEELQKMQDMFAVATGMAAVTVDLEGKFITKPSNFTDFCMNYTRKTDLGAARCAKCDAEGKGSYFCHAGLMDFAEQIIVNGEHVGNILGGQVLPKEPDFEQFELIADELGIPRDSYIAALKKVPVRTEESIRAAADLLRALINMLVNLNYTLEKDEKKLSLLSGRMDKVIESSRQITSKAANLEKISRQQNMLSLNASIEAARSGEAGLGFTIVAKRMGELTRSSADIYGSIIKDAHEILASATELNEIFE